MKIGWVDLAWEVYNEMTGSSIQPNVYTLNIMVNALCKDGKIESIMVNALPDKCILSRGAS